jgi:ABC-type glycerol-3-phosphate transport system permease component
MSEARQKSGKSAFLAWAFLFSLGAIVAAPFLWMLITSLQPDLSAVLAKPFKFPFPPAFGNYPEAWRSASFGIYTFNSIFTSLAATILQVINAILCAYAFTNLRFPGRNLAFTLVLVVLMIPSQVAVVPSYAVISRLGWLDTYKGLIIPFAVDAFGIFLIRQTFISIPKDYAEAAKIEGAGHLRIAFSILGRMAGPSVAAFSIMAFKWRWNDYFWVLLMTTSDRMRTLPVGVVMMKEVGEGGTRWQVLMAAAVIVMIPIMLMYAFLQKYFTDEYLQGGLKI